MAKQKAKIPRRIFCVLLCLAVGVTAYTLWGNLTFTVTRYTVPSSRLPASFRNYKIVQVSDLHGAAFGKGNRRLLAALAAEKPDMIVLTGDLFDPDVIPDALAFTAEAVTIAPCYYVTGNHEAWLHSRFEAAEQALLAQGVTVLHNKAVPIRKGEDTLWLVGIDDPSFAGADEAEEQAYFSENLARIAPESGFRILLSHRPEGMSAYAAAGIDLVFSGHAHGGQIRLPFIGGLYAPNQGLLPHYDGGLFEEGGSVMVLSRGLGNPVKLPRFCNTPELVVVTLT